MSFGPDAEKDLPVPPLVSVFFRSFFIQAGWNYERFQNLGFAFSIMPVLRKLYSPGPSLNSAALRHLARFNTQPYMAGFVIGNIIRMEEEFSRRPGEAGLEKKMLEVKAALASGFAAIGDRVFWGRLKPITTQLCIAVWLLAGFYGWLLTGHLSPASGCAFRPSTAVLFAGPLSGIAVYSAFAVYLRWVGLKRGYACGGVSSCGLDSLNWAALIKALSVTGFVFSSLIMLAAFSLLVASNWSGGPHPGLFVRVALVLSVMALQRVTRKFGRSIFFTIGITLAASIALFTLSGPGGFGIQ